ncbi:uncharacterized protein V6R79_021585 [Siganus canaliculatus]
MVSVDFWSNITSKASTTEAASHLLRWSVKCLCLEPAVKDRRAALKVLDRKGPGQKGDRKSPGQKESWTERVLDRKSPGQKESWTDRGQKGSWTERGQKESWTERGQKGSWTERVGRTGSSWTERLGRTERVLDRKTRTDRKLLDRKTRTDRKSPGQKGDRKGPGQTESWTERVLDRKGPGQKESWTERLGWTGSSWTERVLHRKTRTDRKLLDRKTRTDRKLLDARGASSLQLPAALLKEFPRLASWFLNHAGLVARGRGQGRKHVVSGPDREDDKYSCLNAATEALGSTEICRTFRSRICSSSSPVRPGPTSVHLCWCSSRGSFQTRRCTSAFNVQLISSTQSAATD